MRFVNYGMSADDNFKQGMAAFNAGLRKDPVAYAISSGSLPERACMVDAEIDPQSRQAAHLRVTGEGCCMQRRRGAAVHLRPAQARGAMPRRLDGDQRRRRVAPARRLGRGRTIVTVLADYGTRYQGKLFNPVF